MSGSLKLSVHDAETGEALTVRMHLKNAQGRSIHPPRSVGHADYFLVQPDNVFPLAAGDYEFVLEKGLEYRSLRGTFAIEKGSQNLQEVTLERIADLRKEGWWSGDLLVKQPIDRLRRMMDAEDVQVACMVAVSDSSTGDSTTEEALDQAPWIVAANQLLRHTGGDIAVLGHSIPIVLPEHRAETPATQLLFEQAWTQRRPSCVVALRPYAWDLPVWLAQERIDAICLLNGNLRRTTAMDEEDHGRPRDRVLYPPMHGNARWSQKIYADVLNLGLRIPPVAASESGISPNPVGYNRVCVHCDGTPTLETWWDNLRQGRVFITNGPLLRVAFNGEPPGHQFVADTGQSITIECEAQLATREKIEYLQLIRNGEVVHDVRLESLVEHRGKLPTVTFDRSGWLMVRAVTVAQDTYRMACTGPIYVQIGDSLVTEQADAGFWSKWIDERTKAVHRLADGRWPEWETTYRQTREFFAKLTSASLVP
ncbi:MAG: hypothetical protein O2931_10670 [Planctomycetota bacterium]|nr:hypothetical protein [Planctomycetota bacterium]MDA1179246.1 hypothetical protein [Planctomycetota bacterium]